MKWWERLDRAMKARRISEQDVSRITGIPVKSVYGYTNGDVDNPRGNIVAKLAAAVGMSEQELRYGNSVNPAKRIPLLDMHNLGSLKPGEDPLSQWDGISVIEVSETMPDGCWAVTLLDDSNATEFPMGSVVICDPRAPIVPGKYVVAIVLDDKQAHFGKLRLHSHNDAGRFTIVRSNPDFPDIEVGGRTKGFILARAIKHIRDI